VRICVCANIRESAREEGGGAGRERRGERKKTPEVTLVRMEIITDTYTLFPKPKLIINGLRCMKNQVTNMSKKGFVKPASRPW